MAGGQRIDDHSAWMGSRGKGVPLPDGAKMKTVSSAEGAGHVLMPYQDSNEEIVKNQKHGDSKIRSHAMKPGYRY